MQVTGFEKRLGIASPEALDTKSHWSAVVMRSVYKTKSLGVNPKILFCKQKIHLEFGN
jgi:hypothetical protein